MFLKNLKIRSTVDNSIIKDVSFKMGANFIVDADKSKKHNKIGKTTFLRLIDVALGAKERKNIYVDSETGAVETHVQNLVNNSKLIVELKVVDDFENPSNNYLLSVGLYERGPYKINGNQMNYQKYLNQLNQIFFNNEGTPTFRQLINSFVRISMSGDDNSFLKNLTRISNNQYRMVYDYLFDISDQIVGQKREELLLELKTLKTSLKRYEQVENTTSPDALTQIITVLKSRRDEYQEKINDIVSSEYFQLNRERIDDVREQYTEITTLINQLSYKNKLNEEALSKLDDSLNRPNLDLTNDFFKEVKSLLPTVTKTFDELVLFNEKLVSNKKQYLKEVMSKTVSRIREAEKERELLIDGNRTLIALVQNNKIDEYLSLLQNLSQVDQNISSNQTILKTLNHYNRDIDQATSQLHELNEKDVSDEKSTEKMELFNKYFVDFAQRISQESPVLSYTNDFEKFPVKITSIDGSSTGTRKSLIAAYDLAYQAFAKDLNKAIPNFIIHDVMENIESGNLESIVTLAETTGSQYIVAILQENLNLALQNNVNNNYKILELSSEHKLFDV
ncbi:DUF2326 domain-containing protein [Leuconostoc mesenteroides]|uniref:DUF2326 domain-containing protein n=1 Tax=Leuconostoc mesenteroides TaxID=1245 RepID=UPI0038854D32